MTSVSDTRKWILITGCSSGIGLHCARRLKEEGWNVMATARREEDLALLKGYGIEAIYLDYQDETSIRACFSKAMALSAGRLDALFNNGVTAWTQASA